MLKLEAPGGESRVLLHSCCAPCSGAVLECLLANGIRPVVFFSNSNITPFEEYELRRNELARYCESLGVEMIDDEYDHAAWRDFVLGDAPAALANAPERGPRCLNCFKFRLKRAAEYAAAHDLPVLTTTLASSRWKSLEQVAEAGSWTVEQLKTNAFQRQGMEVEDQPVSRLVFWPQNWRKGGLQERRSQIICEQGFYNQNWCGCEFSRRNQD